MAVRAGGLAVAGEAEVGFDSGTATRAAGLLRPVVWALGLLGVGLVLVGLALVPVNRDVPEAALGDFAIPDLTAGLLFSAVGAWLAVRRPRNAVGWLILVIGAGAALSFFTTQYAAVALVARRDWGLPLGRPAAVVAQSAFVVPNVIQRGLIIYAFPHGRLDTRPGRFLLAVSGLAVLGFLVAALAVPYPWYEARPDVTAPLAPTLSGFSDGFFLWFGRAFAPVTALCTLALLRRLIHSDSNQRGPLVLFTAAAMVSFVQFSVVQAVFPDFSEPIWLDAGLATAGLLAMAGASVVAVLRYRLWDIDVIVRRSLVFGALTACLAGAYLGLVALVDILLGGNSLTSSLTAAVVVAAVATPLRGWLQRAVDHFIYGDRRDPDAAMARLGRRLGALDDVGTILAEVAAGIGASLRVPFVAVSVTDDTGATIGAHWGRPNCGTESIPLQAHGDVLGRLEIGRREPHRTLVGADRRLLEDLARQAALAASIVRRTHELQLSRQRLVSAREEERRRLRRDLHDGLGPALAATTLQLDEATDLIETDPEAARHLIRTLRKGTQELIADVRRLVYGLRPPALDELGLMGALGQYAENLSSAGPVRFVVETEIDDVQLPAAVEVALWRIATEAMTNVVRHAQASRCTVGLSVTAATGAKLEVIDDGCGIDDQARPGVGLRSMHERAGELGGRCQVETAPEGGTQLLAVIPVPAT